MSSSFHIISVYDPSDQAGSIHWCGTKISHLKPEFHPSMIHFRFPKAWYRIGFHMYTILRSPSKCWLAIHILFIASTSLSIGLSIIRFCDQMSLPLKSGPGRDHKENEDSVINWREHTRMKNANNREKTSLVV
jgi:hypothetical protein